MRKHFVHLIISRIFQLNVLNGRARVHTLWFSTGFTGRDCDVALRLCDEHECRNNALCLVEDQTSVCYCVPDFHGKYCQYQYDECQLGTRYIFIETRRFSFGYNSYENVQNTKLIDLVDICCLHGDEKTIMKKCTHIICMAFKLMLCTSDVQPIIWHHNPYRVYPVFIRILSNRSYKFEFSCLGIPLVMDKIVMIIIIIWWTDRSVNIIL